MSRTLRTAVFALACLAPAFAFADEVEQDPKAVEKIKQFLDICTTTPDINEASLKIVAANLVQASKLDKNDPRKLNPDSIRFGFKKAHGNANMYVPLRIVRVMDTNTSAVGFGKTGQKGKLHKYFVAKKDGVNGMPAPIQVFFPEGGAEPVIYDFGSF